ncbi:MAG: hypothetical protein JRI23_36260 [Deltaproteobacteria bacterium]|nr:hypothetical protein [Deltaproteobacteria bacterium]MBW2537804.1 hypothetical protein [Deltaproteobacteria bacterium]
MRNSQPNGTGIAAQSTTAGARSSLTLQSTVVEGLRGQAVAVIGSDGLLEGVVVSDTVPAADGLGGWALSVREHPSTGERANVVARSVLARRSVDVGVLVAGADLALDSVVVRDTQPGPAGNFGHGVLVFTPPGSTQRGFVQVASSRLTSNHEVGIAVQDADAVIEGTLIQATATRADGSFGDGVAVVSTYEPSGATVATSLVEGNGRAGVASFAGQLSLGQSAIFCNTIDLAGEQNQGQDYQFVDLGDNRCGCDELDTCRAVSSNLEPPSAP